ncbi:MFS transporter [Capillimicrobium parvum]|uniref:2-nitroimidazole transporter n=1 Tax=Capillimicrobium parvum TaxID=2884022 RepID=A0A9E7C007_9ACTN|nr:MFS transporter [Capillimicrobium parvum]UGS35925.1 2-nitroimidazole transporter [Capillimicrobium parvum]
MIRRAPPPAELARRHATLAIVALTLAALNLRPGLSSVGPVLPRIRSDLSLTSAEAGLLTTLPSLCFAAFAPMAARLSQRFGTERTVIAALGLIGIATALRWPADRAASLFGATIVLGFAIAIAQTLLPPVVKRRFPGRAVLATGAYALAINLGALMAASLTAPAAHALGGSWEAALGIWSLLTVPAVAAWVVLERVSPDRAPAVRAPTRLPWRSPLAWKLTLYMGGLSIIYIVLLTWLAPRYEDLGYSDSRAALVLTVFTAGQIVGGVLVPLLARHRGDLRRWLAVSTALVAVGALGLGLGGGSAPWVWATLAGLGMGGAFPLTLTLFVIFARTPEESSRLTAMGFSIGYLIAAVGPALAGALRDITGSLALPITLLGIVALIMLAGIPSLRRTAD